MKDSAVARGMVDHAVDHCGRPYGLELVGLTAHVYADTFSHWGFSGVSSRRNRVAPGSVKPSNDNPIAATFFSPKLTRFFERFGPHGGLVPNFRAALTGAANLGALGHGAVATSPDQPFLVWSYEYESFPDLRGRGQDRINPIDFLDGARALHRFFTRVAEKRPDATDATAVPFDQIAPVVRDLIRFVGDADSRAAQWSQAFAAGRLGLSSPGIIPAYDEVGMAASRAAIARTESDPRGERAYRFYQGAAVHRTFVLRELLPAHDVVVV